MKKPPATCTLPADPTEGDLFRCPVCDVEWEAVPIVVNPLGAFPRPGSVIRVVWVFVTNRGGSTGYAERVCR